MFKRILIANRGEVAVRIIRACWEMGIETIAVYSTEDKESMHVRLADKSVCIGPASARESYLNINTIINVAKYYEVDAIHPGYGFLAESSEFARSCLEHKIKFIGPPSKVIELMGNKILAKKTVKKLGIPIIPGWERAIIDINEAEIAINSIGYPILIKAAKGGGGRGIRKVASKEEFEENFTICSEEAKRAFDSDEVYIEKYISEPRHIEVQILADEYKNILILGERDCSIQRKNQKLIEESPATILNDDIRKIIFDYSKKIAAECNYVNAGTVEFLIDKYENVYFMEMNTRLQVEHPVTEMVLGIDIVKEQIRIAYGKALEIKQDNIAVTGHSIECRINAEQPKKNFCVSAGIIKNINIPGGNGIRVDSGVFAGLNITSSYDSNIAKLIVFDTNREDCIRKLKRSLSEFVIDGIETNIEFLLEILNNQKFLTNKHDTYTVNNLIKESNQRIGVKENE